MLFGDELGNMIHVGEYSPVYIISIQNSSRRLYVSALHGPLMDSLHYYIKEIMRNNSPFYVLTNRLEFISVVALLNSKAEEYFNSEYVKIFEIYQKIALEQGLDVSIELRRAAALPTEAEARAYLTEVNLKLRKLVEDFPYNYDNPVRQYGQRGVVRKKKNILPFNIQWP